MARRYFTGRSVDWLQSKLAECTEAMGAGKMSISAAAGDVSAGHSREISLPTLKRMLCWDLYVTTREQQYLIDAGSSRTKLRVSEEQWPSPL